LFTGKSGKEECNLIVLNFRLPKAITALLEQTLHFLEDEGSVLLPEDKQQFYLAKVKKILEKASTPGEGLYRA